MPSHVEYETVRWFNNWDCYTSPHILYIMTYSVQIVTLISMSIIIALNIREIFYIDTKKQQLDKFLKRHDIKILYMIINCLYLMGIICYILAFTSQLSCYFDPTTGTFVFYYLMVIANACIQISAAFVYLFFISRIKFLFQIQWTCILKLFITIFIAQIICQLVSAIFYVISPIGAWDYALSYSLAFTSLNIIFNTALIVYFVYKIYFLIKQTQHENYRAIITFALRHLYSTLVCLISTNVVGFMKIFRMVDNDNFYFIMIQNIACSLDVLLTLFFLLIQFQFANYIYLKLSCCCEYVVTYYINSHSIDNTHAKELTTTTAIEKKQCTEMSNLKTCTVKLKGKKEPKTECGLDITSYTRTEKQTNQSVDTSKSDSSRTTTSELELRHQRNIKFFAKSNIKFGEFS